MKVTNVSKFTLAVYKFVTPSVLKALEQEEIQDIYFSRGKALLSVIIIGSGVHR